LSELARINLSPKKRNIMHCRRLARKVLQHYLDRTR
jgi:hypothetical protein